MCSETTKRVLVGKNSCSYSRRSGLRMPGIGYWPALILAPVGVALFAR